MEEHNRESAGEKRARPLWWRALRAAAVAIGLTYAVYLVGMNVFLSTSLFDRVVNHDPVTLTIHYARGWTFFPTRIHARDLDIRSSDSNVEWNLHLDDVEFEVSLLSIPRRRFDVAHARGRGVSLRARQKLDARPASADEVAMLPPIPGFPAYSVRPAGPPSLERWFDEHYELITVRLEDVAAEDVREIWIDDARFQGNARVKGRFFLHPIRAVDVGPAHVEILSGSVTAGPSREVVHDLAGNLDVTIDRFDPRETPIGSILQYVSGSTDLRAAFADAEELPFPRPAALSIKGALEIRSLGVRLQHGVLGAGTRFAFDVEKGAIANPNVAWSARIEATGAIEHDGDPLHVDVGLSDVALRLGRRPPMVRSPRVQVTVETRNLDLAKDPFRDVTGALHVQAVDVALGRPEVTDDLGLRAGVSSRFVVRGWRSGTEAVRLDELDAEVVDVQASLSGRGAKEPGLTVKSAGVKIRNGSFSTADVLGSARADLAVTVDGAALRDAAVVDALLPTDTRFHADRSGTFAVKAKLHVDERVARGHVTSQARGLGIRSDRVTVWGETAADLAIDRWDTTTARLALGPSRISLTNGRGRLGPAPAPGSDAHDFTVRRVDIEAKAKGFDPAAPKLAGVVGRLEFDDLEIPDARALQRALPETTGIRVASGTVRSSGKLELAEAPRVSGGTVSLHVENGAGTVGKASVQGNLDVRLAVRSYDARTGTIDLTGSRALLDKVEIRGLGINATNWRGEAVLHESSLRLDSDVGPRRLDSIVRFDADDARPILAAVLHDVAPKFLADFVKMPRLAAWGRLHVAPDTLLLSDVDASGGDVAFRGCYGVQGSVKEGAFVVEKGPLSVGIGVEPDGGAYPKFFGLKGWLAEHTDLIKARSVSKGSAKAKAVR